jgi:lipopolysaccharide transport system ATP-binding protein
VFLNQLQRGEDGLIRVEVVSPEQGVAFCGGSLEIYFDVRVSIPRGGLRFSFQIINEHQEPVCLFRHFDLDDEFSRPGTYRLRCVIPKLRLYQGSFSITTWLADRRANRLLQKLDGLCPFDVRMGIGQSAEYPWQPGAAAYLEDYRWGPIALLESN